MPERERTHCVNVYIQGVYTDDRRAISTPWLRPDSCPLITTSAATPSGWASPSSQKPWLHCFPQHDCATTLSSYLRTPCNVGTGGIRAVRLLRLSVCLSLCYVSNAEPLNLAQWFVLVASSVFSSVPNVRYECQLLRSQRQNDAWKQVSILQRPQCGRGWFQFNGAFRTNMLYNWQEKQAVGGRPPRYASSSLHVDNIFVFIRQVAPIPACWLFKTSATSWPLTIWPWNWCPSHVWRGLRYLCGANFSLIGLSVLSLAPANATDRRQTSDKRINRSIT